MNRKGFTLMEMIISLALVGLILVFLTPFLSNSFRALNIVSDKGKYQTVTTVALDYIKSTLAHATAVAIRDDVITDEDEQEVFPESAEVLGNVYCEDGSLYIVNNSAMVYGISQKSIDGYFVNIAFQGTGKNLRVKLSILDAEGGNEIYSAETVIALTSLYDFSEEPNADNKGETGIDRDYDGVWYSRLYYCIQFDNE